MTKRFFIGYSLITFFLLNSVVLLAQHKASFVQQWKIEDASHALQIIESADTLELIVPDGLTMWYRQRLTGVTCCDGRMAEGHADLMQIGDDVAYATEMRDAACRPP